MGIDAGVTVSFYLKGKLIKTEYIDCYKFRAASQTFCVIDFDKVTVEFSTEYDSD